MSQNLRWMDPSPGVLGAGLQLVGHKTRAQHGANGGMLGHPPALTSHCEALYALVFAGLPESCRQAATVTPDHTDRGIGHRVPVNPVNPGPCFLPPHPTGGP